MLVCIETFIEKFDPPQKDFPKLQKNVKMKDIDFSLLLLLTVVYPYAHKLFFWESDLESKHYILMTF